MTAELRILRRKRGGRLIGISCPCRTGNKNENATAMFMLIHRREKGERENVCIFYFLFFVYFSLSSSPAFLSYPISPPLLERACSVQTTLYLSLLFLYVLFPFSTMLNNTLLNTQTHHVFFETLSYCNDNN